jgi:hypothetical protein
VFEEAVQLKTLQMVLTILQSPLVPEDEEGIAQLLHVCFRLLANARCADSVHTTAAATLRQVRVYVKRVKCACVCVYVCVFTSSPETTSPCR